MQEGLQPGRGITDAQGHFQLTTYYSPDYQALDGVIPGDCVVKVTKTESLAKEGESFGDFMARTRGRVPKALIQSAMQAPRRPSLKRRCRKTALTTLILCSSTEHKRQLDQFPFFNQRSYVMQRNIRLCTLSVLVASSYAGLGVYGKCRHNNYTRGAQRSEQARVGHSSASGTYAVGPGGNDGLGLLAHRCEQPNKWSVRRLPCRRRRLFARTSKRRQ